MRVNECMAYIMLMLVSMTLTLTQGHSGSAQENNQRLIILTTKQVMSIELAKTVGHFYMTLTLKTYIYIAWPTCFSSTTRFVVCCFPLSYPFSSVPESWTSLPHTSGHDGYTDLITLIQWNCCRAPSSVYLGHAFVLGYDLCCRQSHGRTGYMSISVDPVFTRCQYRSATSAFEDVGDVCINKSI